jgi:lactate dehydrogenase-like 2-hydroxyacid dehydrogenase
MFKGRHEVEILRVPPPPAQRAVIEACADAHLVIGDRRQQHRIDRPVLERMHHCLLIQQPAVGFDAIDLRVARELGIPVANAAGIN